MRIRNLCLLPDGESHPPVIKRRAGRSDADIEANCRGGQENRPLVSPEEELQNFLEPAFRTIIFGEAYDAPTIDEMIETAILTAFTTLLLGGSDTVDSDLSENIQFVESGQKIMGTDGGVDALMKFANEVAGVSSPQLQSTLTKQMDEVNQKPAVRSVGQLSETVQTASNEAMQAEVAKGLMSKGINSKKADGIAEAIVARLTGQELTRTQRNLLSSAIDSPSVQDVISDIMKEKAAGIDSDQNRIYDRGDISDSLTDEAKAALWDLAHQSVGVFSNHDHATATEDSVSHQIQKTLSAETDNGGRKAISQLLKDTTCSADELFVYLSKQVGSDAAEAFAKNRTWPSEVQIPKNSSALNSDGSTNWSRAPQGGYTLDANGNAIREAFAPKIGEVIDRYGAANGRYASPVIDGKAFSYSERALPYVEDVSKYHRYEVTGDFTKIEEYVKNCENSKLKAKIDAAVTAYYDGDYSKLVSYRGEVAGIEDWGKGGATQYEFSLSIEQLVELGLLKEIR